MASTKFTTRIRSNSPGSVSAVLPERPRCRVKATRAALCVNQIPNTGCTRLCSIPHPPSTGCTLSRRLSSPFSPPIHERGRTRTCLMYKRQNAPGRSIPIISLWSGSYCGIAVLPYTGAACPNGKDMICVNTRALA